MNLALAVTVVAFLGMAACEGTGDARSRAPSSAGSRSGGSSSRRGDAVAANVRSACDAVDSMITTVLRADAPRAVGTPSPDYVRARGDTTFAYWYNGKTASGCRVSIGTDAPGPRDEPLDRLTRRLESNGWESLVTRYSADGPDGSQLGFRHGDVLCIVAGRWDGGDDADSTYVPAPGYAIDVVCAPWRSDDMPPDR